MSEVWIGTIGFLAVLCILLVAWIAAQPAYRKEMAYHRGALPWGDQSPRPGSKAALVTACLVAVPVAEMVRICADEETLSVRLEIFVPWTEEIRIGKRRQLEEQAQSAVDAVTPLGIKVEARVVWQ